MADRTEGSITIEAAAETIMEAITDFESYPEWAGVRTATVVARDGEGRPSEVDFELDVPVLGTGRYTLAYRYRDDFEGLSWTTVRSEGPLRDIRGEYVLEELEEGETRVTYRLGVDLSVRLPRFLRRQAARTVLRTALEGLKRRVESGPGGSG